MITVTIITGNSDDRLSQADWSRFVAQLAAVIETRSAQVHFCGGPDTVSPFQNFAFVVELKESESHPLKEDIEAVRAHYGQKSVAWIAGNTLFI